MENEYTSMQGNVYLSYLEMINNSIYEKGMISLNFEFRINTECGLMINNHSNVFVDGQIYWIKIPIYNELGVLINYRILKIVVKNDGKCICKGIIEDEN